MRIFRLPCYAALIGALSLPLLSCSEDGGGGSTSTGGSSGSGGAGGSAGRGGAGGSSGAGGSQVAGSGGSGGSTGGSGGSTGGSGGSTGGSGGSTGGSGGSTGGGADASGSGDGSGSSDSGAGSDGGGSDLPAGPVPEGCRLLWSPSAMKDGDKAFEFLEMPDRNMIHPGAPHLSVVAERDAYRFDSHYDPPGTVDYDRMVFTGPIRNDRLRGEVRGMVTSAGQQLDMVNGQTWKTSWSLFIPSTLKGTGRFTHIYQLKYIDRGGGVSGSPIITLSLSSPDNMALRLWLGGGSFPTVNLASLHDKWLWMEVTIKVAPGNAGAVHWILKDGDKVLVDRMVNGNTWPSDAARVRHKWGIYRGITSGVRTTYMMAADFKGYQCQ